MSGAPREVVSHNATMFKSAHTREQLRATVSVYEVAKCSKPMSPGVVRQAVMEGRRYSATSANINRRCARHQQASPTMVEMVAAKTDTVRGARLAATMPASLESDVIGERLMRRYVGAQQAVVCGIAERWFATTGRRRPARKWRRGRNETRPSWSASRGRLKFRPVWPTPPSSVQNSQWAAPRDEGPMAGSMGRKCRAAMPHAPARIAKNVLEGMARRFQMVEK